MSDERVLQEARAIAEADERSPAAPGSHGASRARLARALLSREVERDAVIERCARVADRWRLLARPTAQDDAVAWSVANIIARGIRSLAGQPSADGGKEG